MALEAFDLHRMTVKDHERSGAAFRTSEVRGGVGNAQAMHQGLTVVDGRQLSRIHQVLRIVGSSPSGDAAIMACECNRPVPGTRRFVTFCNPLAG